MFSPNWQRLLRTMIARRRSTSRHHRRRQNAALYAAAEVLESRILLSTFHVNTPSDGVDETDLGDGRVDASRSTPGDQITLRAAIQEANALFGDDTIILPAGNYRLSIGGRAEDDAARGDLDICDKGNVSIIGAGRDTTIIDASGLDRVFHVFAGHSLSITGVTLTGGVSRIVPGSAREEDALGGGAIFNDGQLTLADSTLTNNTARGSNTAISGGGAIWSRGPSSSVTIIDSILSGNSADSDGGAIYMDSGTLNISDSVLSGNTAGSGGGIYNRAGTLTFNNSTLSGNSVPTGQLGGYGGGIVNAGTAIITNSTLLGNTASRGGAIRNPGTLTVSNSTISGNSTSGVHLLERGGGGIYNNGELTMTNSTVSRNSATNGGAGIYNTYGTVNVQNTIIARNMDSAEFLSEASHDVVGSFNSQGHNLVGDVTGGSGFTNGLNGDQVGTAANPLDALLGPLADNGGPTFTHALLPGSPAIDAGNNSGAPDTDQRGESRPQDGNADGTTTVDIGAFEIAPPPNHPPEILPISPRTIPCGQTSSIPILATDADGDPLSYTAEFVTEIDPLAQEAYELDQTLGLAANSTFNWGGAQEKWMGSASNTWYFITPDGKFYEWTNSDPGADFLPGSELIATFDETYYNDSSKLYNAQEPGAGAGNTGGHTLSMDGNRLTVDPAAGFVGDLRIRVTVSDAVETTEETITVTVTECASNRPPVLAPIGDRSMPSSQDTLVIELNGSDPDGDSLHYTAEFVDPYSADFVDPVLLVPTPRDLDRDLGLEANDTYDWGGAKEKWIGSRSGTWYFITPDGKFYEWTGAGPGANFISGSKLVFTLDASCYNDPSKLYNAADHRLTIDGNILTVDPATGFVGDLLIRATVSDGVETAEETFALSVTKSGTNRPPVLAPIGDHSMSTSQETLAIELNGSDPDGDPLHYRAEFVTEIDPLAQKAYELDQTLGLEANSTFNWGGAGEKWLGSASGTWYFITPDGKFYQWTGARPGADFVFGSTLVAALDASYHADPSKLYDAIDPGMVITPAQKAYDLNQSFGLEANAAYDWGGAQEKWLGSASGKWYLITPDGKFYEWTGAPSGANFLYGSKLIETLDGSYYADPSKLYDAKEPVAATGNMAGHSLRIDGNRLIVDPAAGFLGDLTIKVVASDGTESDDDTFTLTLTVTEDNALVDLDEVFSQGIDLFEI
jgi:predicted outer membrane repeat protein